jgi:hypothetical protein
MRTRRMFATLLGAAVAAVFIGPTPAHADTYTKIQNRSDGYCAATSGLNRGVIVSYCEYPQMRWIYQPRSTSPSGHALVKFQSTYNWGCMDSNGGGWGASVYTIACNTGNNQLWEVFAVYSGGTTYYVYKSWGAWTYRGEHLCLIDIYREGQLWPCDTTAYNQQWRRLAA